MPLNPDAVGTKSEPVEVTWTSKDALLYAVGIGAGTDELAFTTENTKDVEQQVFPTFPVVARLAVAARSMPQHRHVQPGDARARPAGGDAAPAAAGRGRRPPLVGTLVAMYDKGKAAVVVTESEATMDGEPLYTHDGRRRSSAARAAGAAIVARPARRTSRPSGRPTTR